MKTTESRRHDARRLAESFTLKTRTLRDGRVQTVHPVTGKWVGIDARSDVYQILEPAEV